MSQRVPVGLSRHLGLTSVALLLAITSSRANAEPKSDESPVLAWSFLIDGGAVPFFWGAALVAGGGLLISPPESPRLFSPDEGGELSGGDAIPDYQVAVLSLAMGAAIGLPNRNERFFHLKGFAEAVVTTSALTQIAKITFGRHRPSHTDASSDDDERISFFSGHSSITWASATYLGLYLQRNVFSQWRADDQAIAWWEPLPLGALLATAIYVPYTRVRDNRHHLSDVVVGASVGTSAAVAFYIYQQLRYSGRRTRASESSTSTVKPTIKSTINLTPSHNGLSLVGRW